MQAVDDAQVGVAIHFQRLRSRGRIASLRGALKVMVSSNRAVLPLGAAYFKTGTVSQGTLASTATVNITYN